MLLGGVQMARCGSEPTIRRPAQSNAKIKVSDLKVLLLSNNAVVIVNLRENYLPWWPVSDLQKELQSGKTALKAKTLKCNQISAKLESAWAANSREEGVNCDPIIRMCIYYASKRRTQASSKHSRLNALLTDCQLRGGYLGNYGISVGYNHHFLHPWDDDSD